MNASDIQQGMEVLGSCGGHVGVVDAVEDDVTIRLKRHDDVAGGIHHFIPMCWVESVEQVVRLSKTHDEVRSQWHLEPFARSD